ncbi:MAG TPA: hypothetical protein VHO24_14720, partial [Opitutaceae bacterium]|nr:hypothetical protein [Opitutaceae bacterium]
AEELVKQLGKNGVLGEVIVDLVWSLATELDDFFDNNSPKRRLIRGLLDHDFLNRMVGYDEAKYYYQELEKVLAPDFNYWLHRGSLELEHGNLVGAERFLNQARGINQRDQNTLTEYAYLLLLKALDNPSGPDAVSFVQEAEAILRKNIATRGDRDPHSYHILVGNMMQWVKTRSMRPSEEKSTLHGLRTTLEDGRRRHPKNAHLAKLSQQLEEELRTRWIR